jgi:outer membrane protein assembly factor BamD
VLRPSPRFYAAARRRLLPVALSAAFILSGCAGDNKKDDYVEKPIVTLYDDAMGKMAEKEYKLAAKSFEEVERQHPYSTWAVKAQLMAAYAYYQGGKFDDAIVAADRFIDLYPANSDVAYAYYLRALCYYEQISDVARDQKMTLLARDALQEVVKRFPESEYARDARLKIDLTTDHMAGKEMEIGRYYLERGFWLASINRFQTVIEKYQTTSHVPEALYRLTEAYTRIGVTEEAKKYAAVLGYNYPGSDWYVMAYRLVNPGADAPEPRPEKKTWTQRAADLSPF